MRNRFNIFLLSLALLGLTGCHPRYSWAPFTLSDPNWKVWSGQAIWRPRKTMPELTGDVIVAVNKDGNCFIQFTKTIPFAMARMDGHRWQVEFPADHRVYAGHYPVPKYFAWLQLPALVARKPLTSDWMKEGDLTEWRLNNSKTGETLRGYFNTP